jgi:uncharacterized membrane protein YuzA (DUF378 family)
MNNATGGRTVKILDAIAIVLVIIGGINWGLVGLFEWNLVSAIFGAMTWFTRLVYVLVGIAALYLAVSVWRYRRIPV